ncbi:ABC transporter permease [Ectothiorhodospira mobilis]|uniref:ABC transporter permease n=1 Tax=Ectothiorhodospira mobilis TaxID=195064 RepID=UPI001908B034|nr:ABC transporter permease [Ectothiorhodospira mobilis]MBK1690828.1 ABC transporter permease [Ectothiorhodospira mobilis]
MNAHAQWIAFKTIVLKEILRFSRIWIQTILPPMITTSLYFIIFGGLIGGRIGEMEGIRYMDFIVPGLIMMAVITNAYSNVVSSFYSSKFQRHLEEMLVSPVPNYLIILGFVGGGVARGLAVGAGVTLVSMFFSPLTIHDPLVAVTVVLLTAVLFSLAGLINGVFARSFDDISIVPTFVLTPLTYLGGVFYSISLLPGFWQDVSLLNPILYMINAFRYGFIGLSDMGLALSYGIILGFVAALFLTALYLLDRGVGIRN